MTTRPPTPTEPTWEVQVQPFGAADARCRQAVLDFVRPHLEKHRREYPLSRELSLSTPLGVITVATTGPIGPGPVRLSLAAQRPIAQSHSEGTLTLPAQFLPDERIANHGRRMVGMDAERQRLQQFLHLLYDDLASDWATRTGMSVADPIVDHLAHAIPFVVILGPPGVGKSMLAISIAHDYVRAHAGMTGTVLGFGQRGGMD